MKPTFVCAALLFACGSPQPPPTDHPHDHHGDHAAPIGSSAEGRGAHLAISCGADAQTQFDRGFFELHNMDYMLARSTFEAAAAAHATCAMMFWGVAMTYFQPLWPGQPTADSLRTGAAAVEKARSATTASAIERDYIAAVAAYYEDWEHTDSAARLKRWAAAQKQLAEHYPDDIEAQAFSALARLATFDKKDKSYAEPHAVAEILEKLLEKRPEHPGLMHYLLHAYDNPMMAQHGVDVARKYIVTSPEAAHALHMPSHIHTRLGNWKESVEANIRSADAALKHPVGTRISRDFLHATDYMTYAYLQMGDDDRAKAVASKIDPATEYELNSGPGAYALAATPARFALERKMWSDAASLVVRKVPYDWDHYPWAEAVTHAARGLGAARGGDPKAAEAELPELDRLKPLVESKWWQERIQIEHDVIAAWIAHDRKDDAKAEQILRAAAAREVASGKDNVEPGHVISAIEELGDLLLELKRPDQALEAFQTALKDSPRRFNAVFGAARAAELAGKTDDAKTYYTLLVELSPASTRPARAQAQAFLAKHK